MSTPREPIELKAWPEPFDAVLDGTKCHEWRRADRDFRVGSILALREWSPISKRYTGRAVDVRVTYIMRSPEFEIPAGYVVMSIARLAAARPLPPSPRCDHCERVMELIWACQDGHPLIWRAAERAVASPEPNTSGLPHGATT